MRSGGKWLVATLVALAVAPATASAVLAAEDADNSRSPAVDAGGWLYSPRKLRVAVHAKPSAAPLVVSIDVQCSKGRRDRRVQRTLKPRRSPIHRRVALAIRRADACYVSATAYFKDAEQDGRIVAKVFGHGNPHYASRR